MLDCTVQAKKARSSGRSVALVEYFNRLKSESLNSSHSIPPEIEDEIVDQFSDFSFDNLEYLLEEVVYPGLLILGRHPNALIGDVILRLVSLESVKTVLFSSNIDNTKLISILDVEAWKHLDPRAICMRLSIISCMAESLTVLNGISPQLEGLVELIFKGFASETYFVHLSATKLISSLIKMGMLKDLILERFLVFQSDLVSKLRAPVSEHAVNRLQFYKYLFSDSDARKFLFQTDVRPKCDSENGLSVTNGRLSTGRADEFSSLISLLVFHRDKLISIQGIELFSLALSDDSDLYPSRFQMLIRETISFVRTFVAAFSPGKVSGDSVYKFSVHLKLLSIVIGNAKTSFLVSADVGVLIVRLVSSVLEHLSDFESAVDFTGSGIIVLLLRICNSFRPFLRPNTSDYLLSSKHLLDSPTELTESETETALKYFAYSFEVNKLLLVNTSRVSAVFQITEPQVANYSTLLLRNTIASSLRLAKAPSFRCFESFMEDLMSIYGKDCLSSWQLFLLLKYLISLYSMDAAKLLPSYLHSKTVEVIGSTLFVDFDIGSPPASKPELRKYSLMGPNVILTCSELLSLVMRRVPSLDGSLFEPLFSVSEELLRACLSFRPPVIMRAKEELFHDDYTEFLIRTVSVLKDMDVPAGSRFIRRLELLESISEFSKAGLSPVALDHLFFLLEMFLRASPGRAELDGVESLAKRLLMFYIPDEHQDGYVLLHSTYSRLCQAHGRPVGLPSLAQVNEDFAPRDCSVQHACSLDEQKCIDNIVSRFSECSMECTGE